MKIIDLLYKRAKGEEMPKKIRISHWCYKFEWVEHLENYYDEEADIDLTSAISMGEELNYEVHVLEEVEDKEYEDIEELNLDTDELLKKVVITAQDYVIEDKINALIRNQKKILERLDK